MKGTSVSRAMSSRYAMALAMACAVTGTSAHAQDGSEQQNRGIDEIIVTAQKTQQNINDVGMSITAISGDQLVQQGITSPDQLAKVVPGFNFTRSGYGQPVYTVRGVGFYDVVHGASPAVTVYVNEVPLPYSSMTKGAALDVQRVEVLKGPQGTLFGQNATGGAVNYIANRPTTDLQAGIDIGVNHFGRVTTNAFVSGPISETLRARVAGSIDRGGAWQKSTTRDDSLGDNRIAVGRLLVDWDPTPDLALQFNVNGWSDKSDEQAAQVVAVISGLNSTPAIEAKRQQVLASFARYATPTNARQADWDSGAGGLINGQIDDIQDVTYDGFQKVNDFLQLSMRGDYDFGGATLTFITAWAKMNARGLNDTDGMDFNNYNVSAGAELETFSQEVRLAGNSDRLQWVIGGNYQQDEVFNFGDIFPGISTFPFPQSASIATTKTKALSAFAHVDWEFIDDLSLVAGIRYSDVRINNVGCTLDINGLGIASAKAAFLRAPRFAGEPVPTVFNDGCYTIDDSFPAKTLPREGGLVSKQLNESNIPWKVGLNWKVNGDSLLYALLSRGYKAGTFSPVGATFASQLDPATQETVLAYEAGFKLSLAENRVQLNAAGFYYDYENKQIRGRIPVDGMGLLNKTINVPKSRIAGGEVQLVWAPTQALRLNASASYSDSKIVGSFQTTDYFGTGGAPRELGGQVLPLTPKWQAQGDVEYRIPVSSNSAEVFLGANVQHKSSSYSGLGENALAKIKAYTNLDLRIGVREIENRWSATLYVDNVTDNYSWNFVNSQGPDTVTRIANLPRTFGARFSYRY